MRKKEFVITTLDPEYKTFTVHMIALSINLNNEIHLSKRAQIAYLKADKAPTKVLSKYIDFADIFLLKLAIEFSEYMRINNHIIKLLND